MSDDEIPTLTQVVKLGKNRANADDDDLAELREQLVTAVQRVSEEISADLTREFSASLDARLRDRLPEVVADVLKDYFDIDS